MQKGIVSGHYSIIIWTVTFISFGIKIPANQGLTFKQAISYLPTI